MNKKLLLSLTLAATAFVASCTKTDSTTTTTGTSSKLVPVTLLSLPTTSFKVGVGGTKYVQIEDYWPANATLVKEAFKYTPSTTAGLSAATVEFDEAKSAFKITGVTAGPEQIITVAPTGATSRALNATSTLKVTVEPAATEPTALTATVAGTASSNGVLPLTVAAGGTVPFTLTPTPGTATVNGATLEEIKALEPWGNKTAVDLVGKALIVGADTGTELVVIGAQHNNDVNVAFNLTIVDNIIQTFTGSPIGNVSLSLAYAAAGTLSTLNAAADATNVTTDLVVNIPIAPNTTVQTITAAGMQKLIATPLGATIAKSGAANYTAAVAQTTGNSGALPVVTPGNDGSLVIKTGGTLPTADDVYTITISSNAANPVVLATFTVTFTA